jgi:DNA-binding transcriptional MerR regulator
MKILTLMLTLNEVSKKTGLSQNFIRLCKTKLGDILNPYIYRGDKNKLLFEESAIILFDKIKSLKDDGMSLAEIVRGFKHEFTAAMLKSNKAKLDLNRTDNLYTVSEANTTGDILLKNMIHGRIQALEADKTKLELEKNEVMQKFNDQDKKIRELEKTNLEMKTALKSLPYGRTPEQIRNDYEMHQQQKKEKMRLLIELKNTGAFSFFKKRKIINELMEFI